MRASEILRRGILKVGTGGILNRIKIQSRRNTLFFEEIGANYVKECERSGFSRDMEIIGKNWMSLYFKYLLPNFLKNLPPRIFLNKIIRKIWISIGMMEWFEMKERNRLIEIKTRNEGLTRCIGRNNLMVGFYEGILESLFDCEFRCACAFQTKSKSRYLFKKTTNNPLRVEGKEKSLYYRLNNFETFHETGFTLKDALKINLFELRNNRIYFRGKSISPIENTLFHLIGNRGLLIEDVARISYGFFIDVINGSSTHLDRIKLLKTILQVMGWGIIKIRAGEGRLIFDIKYPAYGLQSENDNWDFLAYTILGYLWHTNERFTLAEQKKSYKRLKIVYSF